MRRSTPALTLTLGAVALASCGDEVGHGGAAAPAPDVNRAERIDDPGLGLNFFQDV
jgi:hypothetical protein